MFDKNSVMKIEFECSVGGFTVQKVAIYNKNRLTEQEAREIILQDQPSNDLVIMTEDQFNSVFLGLNTAGG